MHPVRAAAAARPPVTMGTPRIAPRPSPAPPWLNSLHMSTLTLSLEKEGFAREQLLEGSGITPPTCLDLRRLDQPLAGAAGVR
ncbi:hypothetical protein ACPA9J_00970 [Pseudomonas aeruginosa]